MRNFGLLGISLHLSRIDRIENGELSASFCHLFGSLAVGWPNAPLRESLIRVNDRENLTPSFPIVFVQQIVEQ
jgi:hypothetical protein